MKARVTALIFGLFSAFATGNASAEVISSKIVTDEVINGLRSWLQKPVVFISVEAQNRERQGLGQEVILRLDKQWRKERGSDDQPLIAATLSNPLSSYLTQVQAASAGLLTEIIVGDAYGLNVGQSAITSDYWQGDEAKFKKTFPLGAGAVFVDEPEFHKGTKTWRAQVNLTLAKENRKIGFATVEINLSELARRRLSDL